MKIEKINIKYYKISIVVFLLFVSTLILTALNIKHSIYLYFLVLGSILAYYVLKETDFSRITVIVLTSVFWGSSLVIVLSAILSMLSISLNIFILWLPLFLLSPLLVIYPIRLDKIDFSLNNSDIILIVFAIFSITAKVLSVKDFIAPILHDPISHATWAKEIFNTGQINYFYSPGLHIVSALGMMADGVNVSKYILIITNLFNALSFVPVFLFVKNHFRSQWFAILSGSIFLLAPYPSAFFWASGKNALVMAIPVLFLLLFISSLSINKLSKFLSVNILVFALILIHYPAAMVGIIGSTCLLFLKDRFKGLLNLAIGCCVGILWGVIKMGHQASSWEQSVPASFPAFDLTMRNILSFTNSSYQQILVQFQFPYRDLFFGVGLVGLLVMGIFATKHKQYTSFSAFFIGNLLLMFVIKFSDKLSYPLNMVYSTQLVTFFIFIYIGLAFMFAEMLLPHIHNINSKYIIVIQILLILFVGYRSYKIYSLYLSQQTAKNLISQNDLVVFDWISDNIDEDAIILNNANVGNRSVIVFASDGGAWIPVFADREIAMPFTEMTSQITHDHYGVYTSLSTGTYTCTDIEYLLDNNIRYYYQDSAGVYGGLLKPSNDNKNFQLIFSYDSAKFFEIIPCK